MKRPPGGAAVSGRWIWGRVGA